MSGGGWPAPGIVAVGDAGDAGGGTSFSLPLPGPLVASDVIVAFIGMAGNFSGEVNITGTGGQFWFERVGRGGTSAGEDIQTGAWTHFITAADETGMTTMDFTTTQSVDALAAVFYVLDSHKSNGGLQFEYDQGNSRSASEPRYMGPHFYMNAGHGSFHVLTKQLTWAMIAGNAYTSSYGPPSAAPPGWTFDGISVAGNAELYIATKVGGDVGAPLASGNPIEPVNYNEEVIIESSGTPGIFLPGYVQYFGGAVDPPLAGLDEFPGPFCAPGNGWTWDAWGDPDNCKNALGYITPSPGASGYGAISNTSFAAHYHQYHVDIEEDVPYWGILCTPSTGS